MSYFVYILEMENGQFYVGSTSDLNDRIRRHSQRDAAITTNVQGFKRLIYSEKHPSRAIAMKREIQLKGWSRAKKLALVNGDITRLKELSRRREKQLT